MRKDFMVCKNCIKFDKSIEACRAHPKPYYLETTSDRHYCAEGIWKEFNKRYKEWELYYWGEEDPESDG